MSHERRPETNAGDYFGNQQKKLAVADRRPVIRRPSDLVGPGIAATATSVADFNDRLATYNGFFSANNALNQPEGEWEMGIPIGEGLFVGFVSADSELGGVQEFTDLTTSGRWYRTFRRNPLDPDTIYWGHWIYLGPWSPM